MTKNIGISGTPEEIKIIGTLLELEGFAKGGCREQECVYLVTYNSKMYDSFGTKDTSCGILINKKEFKASEFDQAYQYTPVYEQDQVVLNIGNPKQRVLINKDGVTCEGKTMDFFDLQMIKGRIDNARSTETWIMEVSEIKIGCSKFSIEEFEQVIEASKKFKS